MAFYDPSFSTWTGPSRTSPFDSRPNLPKSDDVYAFNHQLEEVEKAIDNLVKSGKLYAPPPSGHNSSLPPTAVAITASHRRDSVPTPTIPRSPLDNNEARMHPSALPSRHYSIHNLETMRNPHDGMRSQSVINLHSYYANQRLGQRTPDDDIQMQHLKRRIALARERGDVKTLPSYPSEYSGSGTVSGPGSASSSVILDSNGAPGEVVHSPLALSDERQDSYSSNRRRFRPGSNSVEGLGGINESDLTPRAGLGVNGPATSGVIGMMGNRQNAYDPFATEFAHHQSQASQQSTRDQPANQAVDQQPQHQQRSHTGESASNSAESPSPRSATFSLFSAESSQAATSNTSTSSPETSPLKTTKPSLPVTGPQKIAPIGTKRSTGSLNCDGGEKAFTAPSQSQQQPSSMPSPGNAGASIPSPESKSTATPASANSSGSNEQWNFSSSWGTGFGGNAYHNRPSTNESSGGRGIWGGNSAKTLGMAVGSPDVGVWG